MIPEALVDRLVTFENDLTVAARLTDILSAGLEELIVCLVPISAVDDDEQKLLMHWIGLLQCSDLHHYSSIS